jgi:hypothetical protein
MRWNREQYLNMMTFGASPRPMFTELFGPLVGLDAEWRAQGASEAEIGMVAFDWDYVAATRTSRARRRCCWRTPPTCAASATASAARCCC